VLALIERLQQQARVDAKELARRGRELTLAQAKIDKLNFEIARLRRWQFGDLVAAQQAAARDLARRVARAQPDEHLSVLEHLDPSAPHLPALHQATKARDGSGGVVEDSKRPSRLASGR
jgi:transposase